MADKVRVEVVTPTRVAVEGGADMVVVPGGDGDFGVLPGHAPLLSTVRPGTVELYESGKVVERLFVAAGFAEVNGERCTVLVHEAMPVADLTRELADDRVAAARKAMEKAESESDKARAEAELAMAEAMIAVLDQGRRAH